MAAQAHPNIRLRDERHQRRREQEQREQPQDDVRFRSTPPEGRTTQRYDEERVSIRNTEGISSDKLTKMGTLDRRLKGQRDLPDELILNKDYRPARVGGTLPDGTHITLNGRPDLRFKENRGKPMDQVMAEWAQQMMERYGNGNGR